VSGSEHSGGTSRVIGDTSVPLTPSRNPEVKFPQVATMHFPTTVIDALVGDQRSDVVLSARRPEETRPLSLPIDIVEEWGLQSFPASDPPANW
jgi:hypothetical protein